MPFRGFRKRSKVVPGPLAGQGAYFLLGANMGELARFNREGHLSIAGNLGISDNRETLLHLRSIDGNRRHLYSRYNGDVPTSAHVHQLVTVYNPPSASGSPLTLEMNRFDFNTFADVNILRGAALNVFADCIDATGTFLHIAAVDAQVDGDLDASPNGVTTYGVRASADNGDTANYSFFGQSGDVALLQTAASGATEKKLQLGKSSDTIWNLLEVYDGGSEKPGLLTLFDHTGTPWYLWVDNTGDLRIHSAKPTDEDVDGTVVGTQT